MSNNYEEITNAVHNKYVIVQELIHSLKINDYKFNIRLYLLVICKNDNTDFYLHKQGKCLYTSEPTASLNTNFNEHITNTVSHISDEMPNHIEKWGGSMNQWYSHVNNVIQFGNYRQENVFNHLSSYFGLSETSSLTISSYPEEGGKLVTSGQIIPDNP